MNRNEVQNAKRWVIKIGSALLTNDGKGLDKARIADWVAQIAKLHQAGIEVILVSSGAVAAGMQQLGWSQRPTEMADLQAAAAVGQASLVQYYQDVFSVFGMQTAQILLTHDDLSDRTRYLNARNTVRALIKHRVIPIINENDTVVTDEIKFGDNDTLGALVANLIEADALMIMTDQDGIFTDNPRTNPEAELIKSARANDPYLLTVASGAGTLGRGGMATKVTAARLAARSGTGTIIAGGRNPDIISRIYGGEEVGSWLYPDEAPLTARKQWLAGHLRTKGKVVVDAGAKAALMSHGKSLLAVGVKQVTGAFQRGDAVSIIDNEGNKVAIGLANYSQDEAKALCGVPCKQIGQTLGYEVDAEFIHRDNLVLL